MRYMVVRRQQEGALTALAQAALDLEPGESAEFVPGYLSTVIGNMSYVHWSMAWHYDASRKEFQALGKDAAAGGGTGRIGHIMFDEATSTWRLIREWGDGTLGHVFCQHTIDPAGDHYFTQYADKFAQRYSRAADLWNGNTSTSAGNWGSAGPASVIAYHSNLFGVGDGGIVALVRQLPVVVYLWRKSTDVWSGVSASAFIAVNTKDGAAIYSPALDAVICGSGDATLEMLRVDAGGIVSEIAPVPIAAGDHFTRSPLTVHPVSGKPMLLQQPGGNQVWIYEPAGDFWDLQAYSHPFNTVASTAPERIFIPCSVPAHGIVAGLVRASVSDDCRWWNWRPPN